MNRIKKLRQERGETLEKLAKYLNVTIQTISNYENEKRDITPEVIIKLAEYFDVSTDYLLGKTDKRNNDIDLSNVRFAQHGGIDTEGLSEEDIEEIKKQVEYMRWKRNNQK